MDQLFSVVVHRDEMLAVLEDMEAVYK